VRKAAVTANLLRPNSQFFLLHGHEVDVLDMLPLWMTRLFLAIVRCSDFKTGAGSTSFAQLALMLAPLQPARGRRHYRPDEQAIKKGVKTLEDRRILARDKKRSDQEKLLFFAVCDRQVEVRPAPKLDPLIRSLVDKAQSKHRRGFADDA
jgi:hypothetical protein